MGTGGCQSIRAPLALHLREPGGFHPPELQPLPCEQPDGGGEESLKRLKDNKDIVIKPADKGSKIVMLDRADYLHEALRQLRHEKHYIPLTALIFLGTQRFSILGLIQPWFFLL